MVFLAVGDIDSGRSDDGAWQVGWDWWGEAEEFVDDGAEVGVLGYAGRFDEVDGGIGCAKG